MLEQLHSVEEGPRQEGVTSTTTCGTSLRAPRASRQTEWRVGSRRNGKDGSSAQGTRTSTSSDDIMMRRWTAIGPMQARTVCTHAYECCRDVEFQV